MSEEADREKRGAVVYAPDFGRQDEQWLESLRAGKREARAELYRRHAQAVEGVLVRVLGWNADIPDLVQEVFVRVLAGLAGFRGDQRSLKPWITRIAVHTARGWIRKRRLLRWLRLERPEDLPEVSASTATPEEMETLRRAYRVIDSLPERERIAFALRFLADMELAEVAEACEVSLATVKRRLSSARRRFIRLAARDPYLREYLLGGER
jgi:RNA polymerase sigma-70 factor (ECF subfamily)